jgi:hypothetical protein
MILTRTWLLVFAACALSTAANASIVFNFDTDNVGTSTSFTDTVGGLSATFSSAADPGGFVIYASMFDTLTGNVLGDPGPAGFDNLALDVSFGRDLNSLSLDFATSDFGTASPLTLTAYDNAKFVGSVQAMGTVPNGFTFPEGQISFAASPFNNIVISSTAMDFAVDNIAVTATPEPAFAPLLGLVFGAMVLLSLRARHRRATAGSK